MYLERVDLARVRNLSKISFRPGPGLNILFGENGSGKSSILEGIHMLGMGRSFRTNQAAKVVQSGADSMMGLGCVIEGARKWRVGIERLKDGQARLKVDGESVRQLSMVARRLPIQTLLPNGHMVLEGGPKERRAVMDWGMFHVEHDYFAAWDRYRRVLKQRNASLRLGQGVLGAGDKEWRRLLADAGDRIDEARRRYVDEIAGVAKDLIAKFLEDERGVSFQYRRGWPAMVSLGEALQAGLGTDSERGFTGRGPHRADLLLTIGGAPAADILSRGQQKMAVAALKLAQVVVLSAAGGSAIVLVDDLAAELDRRRRTLLVRWLEELGLQAFITVIDRGSIEPLLSETTSMFHVEHGDLHQVV